MAYPTIAMNGIDSKYPLSPDFTSISFSDEEPISKALDYVLHAKHKALLPKEKEILEEQIRGFANGSTIGCLRAKQRDNWNAMDIPLICRSYLKSLIIQSCRLTKQQQLECEFNNGLRYNWAQSQDKVSRILSLGFSRNEALEAMVVTNHASIEYAMQYLLTDAESREQSYTRAKMNTNRCVPPNYHYSILERIKRDRFERERLQQKSMAELNLETQRLKLQLMNHVQKCTALEKKRDSIAQQSKLILYKEYMRGIIASDTINTAKLETLERYKAQRKITDGDHERVLKELNLSIEQFDKMKSFEDTMTNEDECVVCYCPPKDNMILPCNHVCLCDDCKERYFAPPHNDQMCPLCSDPIKQIKKVFYF